MALNKNFDRSLENNSVNNTTDQQSIQEKNEKNKIKYNQTF